MILDWHLTCLGYSTHHANITILGEEEFLKKTPPTFFAPF
jgi:hypothetical protein